MFAVLDTNHFSELVRDSPRAAVLQRNVAERKADVFVTVITAQESFEGWFALINRERAGLDQTKAYVPFGSGDKNEMNHSFNSSKTPELTPRKTSGIFCV